MNAAVLIVIVWVGAAYRPDAPRVTMQAFDTLAACESAAEFVKKNTRGTVTTCTPR